MKRKKLKRRQSKKHFGILIFIIISIVIIYLFSVFKPPPTNENKSSYTANAATPVVWQQFDGDAGKSGTSNDPFITKSNVTTLQKLWQVPISSDGSPVYLSNVTTSQGVKNLVFITTTSGGLTAYDDATGNKIWSVTTTGAGGTVTSSPAIDPNNLSIYSYGKDGKVHKYDVGTGTEETSGGWPLTASLIPNVEKGSSSLAIGNGYLYVTTSAYPGDKGDYVGHIEAKNLTSGAVSVFNTLCSTNTTLLNGNCSSVQSGVWSRPGAVVDSTTGNVFIASGNGSYAPPNNLADSLIELSPDLSKIVDTYTPTNFQQLQNDDADLGSTDVSIIPSLELGIQGGKDNKIRVINLKNMSGQGGPDHTGGELQTLSVNCNIFSAPISWNDGTSIWVFVTDMCNDLYAYKVANNQLQQVYKNSNGGSSPLMVNGMLFIQSSGGIKTIDPTTGTILWTGQVGNMHWQSPAVVNGHVFVIDNSNLTSFEVANNSPTISTPQVISPTFGIVGDCQTNGLCPTPTVTVAPTTTINNPTVFPTTIVVNPTQTPITQNPCIANSSSSSTDSASAKAHNHQNASVSNLFNFLLQLLLLLFKLLLGGGTGPIQVPTVPPCVTPTP
jgi:hypothetical protein